MIYTLYLKHASRTKPERTGYRDVNLADFTHFARGYVRGVNDASTDPRYSGIICDDQMLPVIKINKEGFVSNA
jgi:hypothetical protein